MKSWVSSAFDTNQPQTNSSSSSTTSRKLNEKTQHTQPSTQQRSSQRITNNNKATTSATSNKFVTEKNLSKFAQSSTNNLLLSEKFKPSKRIDLVVNKTKVDQFSNLLDEIFKRDKGSILIVQGPSGCGKMTCLSVLCKEKNVELVTWNNSNLTVNNLNDDFNRENSETRFMDDANNNLNFESQTNLFKQFLFKSSRYVSDQIFSNADENVRQRKCLLIKELPPFIHRDVPSFHNLLRQFLKYSKFSLVFLLTDSNKANENARLFTSDIRRELCIQEIAFNALAPSYLSKHIERICNAEMFGNTLIDKAFIEDICNTSNGDLRYALNLIDMAYIQHKNQTCSVSQEKSAQRSQSVASTAKRRTAKTNSEKKQSVNTNKTENLFIDSSYKDLNLNIFRGLGKILHRKRLEVEDESKLSVEKELPEHLKWRKYERYPMSCDPEEVVKKVPLYSDSMLLYLHQNFLELFQIKCENSTSHRNDFAQTFDSLDSIMNGFLMADQLNRTFTQCEYTYNVQSGKLKEISSLLAIRSLLFNFNFDEESNKSTTSRSRSAWMPLFKPFTNKVNELKAKRFRMAQELVMSNEQMQDHLLELKRDFFTNLLPFLVQKAQRSSSFASSLRSDANLLLFAAYKPVNSKAANQFDDNTYLEDANSTLLSEVTNKIGSQTQINSTQMKQNEQTLKSSYAYETNCEDIENFIDETF